MVKTLGDFLQRFTPALLLAGGIVAAAPRMGQLRDLFFKAFPGQALRHIALFLALVAAALFLLALWRIRENRLLRYGGLMLVSLLLWLQVFGLARGMAQVDLVERFHVLEYGSLAALVYWGLRRREAPASWPELLLWPIFAATLAGVCDEGAQRIFQLRVADFHDVALNAFAALVGGLYAALLLPPRKVAPLGRGAAALLRGLAITLAGLGLFAVAAHFGYEIRDKELGRFRSFYDAEGLAAASQNRATAWAQQPPDGADPWAFKDLYLDEAARHTTYRNDRYRAGDFAAALRANEILEKYYRPFLEVGGFRGSGSNRWSPELLAEVSAQVPRPPAASWESPVLRDHLVLTPKPPFLYGLGALVLLLFLAAYHLDRPPTPRAAGDSG